jgi:hypothetical protein
MSEPESMALNEQGVTFDLNIAKYPMKWRQAKKLALTHHTQDPYWMRARLLFLELGGERKDMERY